MPEKYYTVSEISRLTGVNIKTLHYYQTIGILSPNKVGNNKYRYYTDREIELLQEILFYRSLDISLKEIKKILSKTKNTERLDILNNQLSLMKEQVKDMHETINTIEKTIFALKENKALSYNEQFEGLPEDDSIYRYMQTMTILMNKPISLFYLFFGLLLTYVYAKAVITNTPILAIPGTSGSVISLCLLIVGIVITVVCLRNLLFINTKKWLTIVNEPFKK